MTNEGASFGNVGNVQGDAIGVGVTGSGNIIAKNVTTHGPLTVNTGYLAQVPSEYVASLKQTAASLDEELDRHGASPEARQAVQQELDDLTAQVENVKQDGEAGVLLQSEIKTRIMRLAAAALKALPKGAEAAAAMTPLAPFSKLIGESVEALIGKVQQELGG